MFDIPNYDINDRVSMDSARAQISTAKSKSTLAGILSSAVLVGGAVAVINGLVNAEYVNMASQIGAVIPEAAISLAGGSGVLAHAIYNARLRRAKNDVDFDIAVDDEITRRHTP